VFSFLNNLAVGGTLLLRSREIDGMKFAQSVKAVNCILQHTRALAMIRAGAAPLLEQPAAGFGSSGGAFLPYLLGLGTLCLYHAAFVGCALEMLINSMKGKLLDVETVRYWQKDRTFT
jgi:hypothetical protein